MKNQLTALVPMKGNSERVKNKNLKQFNGVPLCGIILQTLENCESVKEIFIDTDSKEIAEYSSSNFKKVKIMERPGELCGDFVSMNKIIEYDISKSESEHFLQTHSTNPVLKASTLERAIDFYFDNLEEYDSVFSVTMHQTRLYDEKGKAVNHNPDELIRTQDLDPLYEENSNFYIFSKKSFANSGNKRIGLKPAMFEIPKLEAIDIDTKEDFVIAELIHRNKLV